MKRRIAALTMAVAMAATMGMTAIAEETTEAAT